MQATIEKEFTIHFPKKNKSYFEGWYIRVHTSNKDFALIFGISLAENKRAFIQYLDTEHSKIYDFPWEEFSFHIDPFQIRISSNLLSLHQLELHLPEIETKLHFEHLTPLEISRYSPGIMGPFSYFPMECVHSIISLHHHVNGYIKQKDQYQEINGIGYIEKDRGTSFPSKYLWFQSNQNDESDCFFFSYAHIPFGLFSFQGCICVLMLEKQYRFATYLGCKVKVYKNEKKIVVKQYPYTLTILFSYPKGYVLSSSKLGMMCGTVNETLQAEAIVTLKKKKQQIGKWKYTHGGFENNGIF